MGLTRRILLFTSALVAVLAALTVSYASLHAERLAREDIDRGLAHARQVWEAFQADRYGKLKLGVRVLANDPAFKAAVGTGDPATVYDLLAERRRDLDADFFLATDAEGRLVARSDRRGGEGQDLAGEPLVARALEGADATSAWRQDDRLFHAVALPMTVGPDLLGALVAGYGITPALAGQMRGFTRAEVAFLVQPRGAAPRLAASSLGGQEPALAAVLAADTLPAPDAEAQAPFALSLGGEPHLALHLPLRSAAGDRVGSLLLLRSVRAETATFRVFRRDLLTVSAAVLLLALLTAWAGSRRITGPVRELVGHVERVGAGTYSEPVKVASRDEIGALAAAFEHMREGIAAREDRIRHMALQDPLTELPNRLLFADRLQQATAFAARNGAAVSVLLLDVDRFKDVNLTLGPAQGDAVLRALASRLAAALRGSDTVARHGADEFALLLPNTAPEAARRVARQVLAAIAAPLETAERPLHLTASAGIASFPLHGQDGAALLRHAEAAVEVARRTGSGFAVYDPAYDHGRSGRLWLLEELQEAVPRGELVLHYQPQLEVASGRVAGLEALVRWQHPQRGLLGPGEFIPLAEQTGLIRAVTSWAVGAATRDCAALLAQGHELSVAVNVSARDLLGRDLVEVVASALDAAGLHPHQLVLEITESTVMEDPAQSHAVLQRLRERGLRLSIDDFGTGYSSLAYLKKLPVHELKIDQSFVRGLAEGSGDAAIVRSTVELGHNLGLLVVAEGVEDEATWERLRALGCDLAQGYHLGRPQPLAELREFLQGRRAAV